MIDLKNLNHVKEIQSNLRASLGTDAGKEVIKFLEQICGWYDFSQTDPNTILMEHGKRQVLATLKTLINLNPDQVVAVARQKGD